jgi:hypothetical protein
MFVVFYKFLQQIINMDSVVSTEQLLRSTCCLCGLRDQITSLIFPCYGKIMLPRPHSSVYICRLYSVEAILQRLNWIWTQVDTRFNTAPLAHPHKPLKYLVSGITIIYADWTQWRQSCRDWIELYSSFWENVINTVLVRGRGFQSGINWTVLILYIIAQVFMSF